VAISFANQTITILKPNYIVERGDSIVDWSNPTRLTQDRCRLQPRVRDEVYFAGTNDQGGVARDAVLRAYVVFAPYETPITEYDAVEYKGGRFEVEGMVRPWLSATGDLAHIEFIIQEIQG
jgi:hypothetical protein